MIVSTDAIVLKSIKFKETSRIVTAYTEQFGKVSLLAKGARGTKPKFGASLQPMSHSHFIFYKKDNRDLQLLSQADLVTEFRQVTENPTKTALGFIMIEIVNAITQGEERQPKLFALLRTSLEMLNGIRQNTGNIGVRFLMDISAAEGFGIDFDNCLECRRSLADADEFRKEYSFDTLSGGFYCPECSGIGTEISPALFNSLRWIDTAGWDSLDRLTMPPPLFRRALRILHAHIASHHQDMREIRSYALLDAFS